MNLLGFLVLLVLTAAWLVLPLVPALRELFRPTDVEPLTMVGRDNADVARFARNFREYLKGQLATLDGEPDARGEQTGKLPDNTPFMRLARLPNEISRTSMPPGANGRLLVLDQSTVLDGGEQFRLEVWSREDFIGGPSATYRAILGEQNVELAEKSVVTRWVHSVGPLVVGPRSSLYGRTSSEKEVHMGAGVTFDRIGAPVIMVGTASPRPMPVASTGRKFQAPERSRRLGDHLRVEQDLEVPADTVIEGNMVVAGRCWLGRGVRVNGSLKVHRELTIDEGVVITGALVSRKLIKAGKDCWIQGPIISEEHLMLDAGTTVGTPEQPTTVSARTIMLATGVTLCGQVMGEEGGQTT
ncbi:MAG TPA: polymer-forming cytoskeletal protein [Gemmatimonadales bacterium]|nr:polymer-forming cytoskeletal protein [Gemmatimonadales bacterium]